MYMYKSLLSKALRYTMCEPPHTELVCHAINALIAVCEQILHMSRWSNTQTTCIHINNSIAYAIDERVCAQIAGLLNLRHN